MQVATNFYRCEACKYLGAVQEIEGNRYICPKCNSEDIFPERLYRCGGCGFEGDQDDFFGPDVSYDDDPLEIGIPGDCPRKDPMSKDYCGSTKIEQIK